MSMKTLTITCFILFASGHLQAQFHHFVLRSGYLFGNSKIENYHYEVTSIDHTNNVVEFANFEDGFIRNRHIPVDMEAFWKGGLFSMGGAFRPKKWRKEHEDSPGMRGLDGSIFSTKLAFGGYFGESVGLMIGGQYAWNTTKIEYDNEAISQSYLTPLNSTNLGMYFNEFTGGNQRGFGAHLMINAENRMLVRGSVMYDWIKGRKGENGNSINPWEIDGNAITAEAALYFMFDEDEDLGLSFVASYSSRNTSFTQVENLDSPMLNMQPGMQVTSLTFSVNLLLPASMFASQTYTTGTIRVIN